MKAFASTMEMIRPGSRRETAKSTAELVEVRRESVPFPAIEHLSVKLGIPAAKLLDVIGIPVRTGVRRRQEGFLKPGEADRLLRIARVFEEAVRIFGSGRKAARWLNTVSPALYGVAPLDLLDSDAGAQVVSEELIRIDFGDFA